MKKCIICGNSEKLSKYKKKYICKKCIEFIKKQTKTTIK